jgi:hypothetical protein
MTKKETCEDGSVRYYLDGVPHREDGPAIEHSNGTKSYHLHGRFHRIDGPAVEYADGRKSFYINGVKYDEEKFWTEVKK